ncbi:DUF58 domain-containing protein [Nafulsella turpanensis]|uniref:DUF58 domain-containing protein n=1 Tax=Nafulsella turpanensis TaxID=1265690 RepID=UPI000344ED4E|nr:DUF58 domain-containing protein [Nafulsella turpanensis]
MKELLKKLRKYEIQIRKAVNWQMQGNFHSIFKGSGLEFDDVRAYQYGDDVRAIDWKVTAKGHGTFTKTFKEEKEQLVYFLLDVSASQEIGQQSQQKLDIAKEICGVLTLSSIKEASQVGLICFSDRNEKYLRPGAGGRHAYEMISQMFRLQPQSTQTDLSAAFLFALKLIRRRSVIVVLSDFIDTGWEHNLKALARKHDLVVIHIGDKRETHLPGLGLIPVYDKEKQKTVWTNTSSGAFRKKMVKTYQENQEQLRKICSQYQADYLFVDTAENFVPKLISLFKIRNKSRKRA